MDKISKNELYGSFYERNISNDEEVINVTFFHYSAMEEMTTEDNVLFIKSLTEQLAGASKSIFNTEMNRKMCLACYQIGYLE